MNTAALTQVYLVGSLGKRFGEHWELSVSSPAEAIRALDVNTKGELAAYLRGPAAKRWYKVAVQRPDNVLDATEVTHRSGRGAIYIIPTIRGRNSGVGKILVGAALIALSFVNPGLTGFALKAYGSILVGFGTSLVVGGISQLLTPRPQTPGPDAEQANSTSFQGNTTAIAQGGCVPVVYGRMLVSALPISITITNNDVATTQAGESGVVITTNLQGGGQQYEEGGG